MFQPYQDYESKIVLVNLLNQPETFFKEAARYASSVNFSMLYVPVLSLLPFPDFRVPQVMCGLSASNAT
jgi:hypothetical protein